MGVAPTHYRPEDTVFPLLTASAADPKAKRRAKDAKRAERKAERQRRKAGRK